MSKKYKTGLAVGKFYPPHRGHHVLIDALESSCDNAYVGVGWSRQESIPVMTRMNWLYKRHPNVHFFSTNDESPVLYTDETWGLYLDELLPALGRACNGDWPGVVFSGESYAADFADRLARRYRALEIFRSVFFEQLDRSRLKVSASKFRSSPKENWWMIDPIIKEEMLAYLLENWHITEPIEYTQ